MSRGARADRSVWIAFAIAAVWRWSRRRKCRGRLAPAACSAARSLTDLLALSARIIDENLVDGPIHRISQELRELDADLAVVESFSNVICARTGEGLVLFDTSGKLTGAQVKDAVRAWSPDRVHALVYTHGHVDHVGGAGFFMQDAQSRGYAAPRVVGHERIAHRFARYRETNGYNLAVNVRTRRTASSGTAG